MADSISTEVNALPSFARQTGEPCAFCHVQAFGPNLTPNGRNFKLTGYTMAAGENAKLIPLSAMVQGSFTHTSRGQPDGAAEHFGWLGMFFGANVPASSELTRELLGWEPKEPTLLADIAAGHYLG